MLTSIKRSDTEKVIELGGGENPWFRPNVDVRPCYNAKGEQTVDFTADFNQPLPIQSDEWDVVFARFVIEHLSWRAVRAFLAECLRILKAGGRLVVITANTEAQLAWARNNPNGWDGKDAFDSISCVLFGDQDYEANTHKNFMTPALLTGLLQQAGFVGVRTAPYGERQTDMIVEATRPIPTGDKLPAGLAYARIPGHGGDNAPQAAPTAAEGRLAATAAPGAAVGLPVQPGTGKQMTPGELYDKHYWNGGGKVGGYAREGYWDFPVHHVTAAHILARKPESVLEVGCARGYVLKRVKDAGVRGVGLEVSKHCWLTRACEGIHLGDLTQPFPMEVQGGPSFDLCYSVAVLEHIPEAAVPALIERMVAVSRRGLHGIDFGGHDDGFDKTHVTLRAKTWWEQMFARHAPGYPVEIVDKESLEKGDCDPGILRGDGRVKLNIGSHTTMFHHGWRNLDLHDLGQWAMHYGYHYERTDVSKGLDYGTGVVDCIFASHVLEHFDYDAGLRLLKEFRRVIRPDGAVRILVPDAGLLTVLYHNALCERTGNHSDFGTAKLDEFDEISDGAERRLTSAGKLWELLFSGHQAAYDDETLLRALNEAGFAARRSAVHSCGEGTHERLRQIIRETHDSHAAISLIVDAVPMVD